MFDPTKTHPGDPIDLQVFYSVHHVQETSIQKQRFIVVNWLYRIFKNKVYVIHECKDCYKLNYSLKVTSILKLSL